MKLFTTNARARFVAAVLAVSALLSLATNMPGQEQQSKLPDRSSYVNDFAGIIDAATRDRTETILANLKQRSDIEFVVAIVKTIGTEDVYEYSLRLARAWDVGVRTSPRKTLLLVISADQAQFFTQFSKTAQQDLPDGLVGDLILRMRPKFQSGDFSGGLLAGVKSFVTTVGESRNFKFEELDQQSAESLAANKTRPRTVEAATPSEASSPQPIETPTPLAEPSATPAATEAPRPSPLTTEATPSPTESPKTEPSASASPIAIETPAPSPAASPIASPSETPTPAPIESPSQPPATASPNPDAGRTQPSAETALPSPSATASAQVSESPTPEPLPASTNEPVQNVAANRSRRTESPKPSTTAKKSSPAANSEPTPAPNPDDEIEEVELTLTKPVDQRIDVLRAFIAAHPQSVAVPRANELIIAAHAAIGDRKLQAGDVDGGLKEFSAAITEAPAGMTDRLFSEVIARIPMNLFLREQRAAAIDFARQVEALAKLNPKRLLALEEFYLAIENVEEASRIAELAVQQAPDMAAAHQALGAARHIDLRLDEAEKEYARALELDPKSATARRSLADLKRAAGKPEEALALYRELIQAKAADKTAFAGMIISLLEAGKNDAAEHELDTALKDRDQLRNLALLTGAGYWFVAHNDIQRGLYFAQAAVDIEPRYSWAQVALARALIANKRPLEAERALRFARQFGRFPTLDYELASMLASVGLYDEAARELARSFSLKDGQIETKLAGRNPAHAASFIELLGPERRASIFQPTAADSEANAGMLKGLLAFATMINSAEVAPLKEAEVLAAAKEFTAGDDPMRPYRQVYVAGKLVNRGVALTTVGELMDAAISRVEAALDVPAATVAVQPDELSDTRARALAQGGTPDVPDAPRTALSGLLRGRIEDLTGLALFNQDKPNDAVAHLRRAVNVAPEGTPLWRAALWHLGSALEADGKGDQALPYYIRYYVTGAPDPARRAVIEKVYKKVNGTLDGLDDKIGKGNTLTGVPTSSPTSEPTPSPNPAANPASLPTNDPTPSPTPAIVQELRLSSGETQFG